MKKVLMSLSLVAFLALTVSSCLKNDNTPTQQPQDPAIEKPVIDSFINARGLMMEQESNTNGLMRHIISWGDTITGRLNQDSSVAVVSYKGMLLDGTVFDSTKDGETTKFDLAKTSLIAAFSYYLQRLGKGGSVEFVTPSLYGYGPQNVTDESGAVVIPKNSPLYFKVELVDVTNTMN